MAPQREMPGYSASFGADAMAVNYSLWKLFRADVENSIDFRRPEFDKEKPTVTVIRPKPCVAYKGIDTPFMPYRMDPRGRNFFGFWSTQVLIADRIGKPATSFIVQKPAFAGGSDVVTTSNIPLSVLVSAIVSAVKRGQGKEENWRRSTIKRPFEPDPQTVLEWSGHRSDSEMKSLRAPKYLFMVQALIPQLGGKVLWAPDQKEPTPGFGDKTCIVGLTEAAGAKLYELCNLEVENYRGDPGDFESRYVNGDPVDINGGRYIYIYPKGGDPRDSKMANVPSGYNPLEAPGKQSGRGRGSADHEFSSYEMHMDKQFQGVPAAFIRPDMTPEKQAEMVSYLQKKWQFWEDILFFPNNVEQVDMLSNLLPLSMIDYAFSGEHDEWLSPSVKQRIMDSRKITVPSAPPPPTQWQPGQQFNPMAPGGATPPTTPPVNTSSTAGQPPVTPSSTATPPSNPSNFDPLAVPSNWKGGAPNPFPQGSGPSDGAKPDEALAKPPVAVTTVPTGALGSIDEALANAAQQSNTIFSGPGNEAPSSAPIPGGAAPLSPAELALRKRKGQPVSV